MESVRDVCFANETAHVQFWEFAYLNYDVLMWTIILCMVVINVGFLLVKWYDKLMAMWKPSVVLVETTIHGRTRRFSKRLWQSCPKICSIPSKNVDDLTKGDLREIAKRENENADGQESPNGYRRGRYMPLVEGDVLNGKYEVCRKLGYGQFSTVWLCEDQMTSDYVAIKIGASHGNMAELDFDEINFLKNINAINPDHPGFRNIVQMLDYFWNPSINGNHTAIVLEVMGPSLLHLTQLSEHMGLEITGVRTIIKQVLRGLEYLHNECGIIHTDIKPANILIKAKGSYVQHMAKIAKKFKEYGITPPKTYVTSKHWYEFQEQGSYVPVRSCSENSYIYQTKPDMIGVDRKQRDFHLKVPLRIDPNIEVKIGDLGNAAWSSDKYPGPIQTRPYRALEVIMGAGYDCPADIWSVGCLAFELATGEYLFNLRFSADHSIILETEHVLLIREVLGRIPFYITKRGTMANKIFVNGEFRYIPKNELRISKLEDTLVDKYKWKSEDAIPFAGFVYSLIEADPDVRATASAALNSNWINENE